MIINIPVSSKIFIWANSDLDGAASVIALGHIFPEFEYQSCFFGKFQEQYIKWAKNNLENYDKIFVVGMVIDQDLMRKLDDPRIVIISDRAEELKVYDSTLIVRESTSCCKLIYKVLGSRYPLPREVKELILYVDDYNSFSSNFEESKYLNALYRKSGFKRFKSFVDRFNDGYDGFKDSEIILIQEYFDEIDEELNNLTLYKGLIGGYTVISTFSKLPVNEIAEGIGKAYECEVIIIINTDTKFVSFRRPPASTADLSSIASDLCGGGGSKSAAGGSITENFLEFTKDLVLYIQ